MSELDEFKNAIRDVASVKPVEGRIERQSAPDEKPEPTGARLILQRDALEIHGLVGEMPPNIRLKGSDVFVSTKENPDEWIRIEGQDAEALRVFTLLDPRLVIQNLASVRITPRENGVSSVSGHLSMRAWKPTLPEHLVHWMRGQGQDRLVSIRFRDHYLDSSVQQDLPPREGDRIIVQFSAF